MPVEDEREKLDENSMLDEPRYVVFTHPDNAQMVKLMTCLPVRENPIMPRHDVKGAPAAWEVDLHALSPIHSGGIIKQEVKL